MAKADAVGLGGLQGEIAIPQMAEAVPVAVAAKAVPVAVGDPVPAVLPMWLGLPLAAPSSELGVTMCCPMLILGPKAETVVRGLEIGAMSRPIFRRMGPFDSRR